MAGGNAPQQAAPADGGGFNFDAAMASAQQGGSVASADNPPVYLGEIAGSTRFAGKEMPDGERIPAPHDKTALLDKASTMIYRDGVQQRFIDLLLRNGIIERGNYTWDDVEGWWLKAVAGAANAWRYGGKKVTPEQWLELWHGAGVNGAGGGASTQTSVDKSVQQIDDLDARAAAEETYSSLMGRAPKGKEADAIREMLNSYAQNHPSITRQTVHTDAQGNVSRTTKTSGGMSSAGAAQLVDDQVKSKPGYAEYQAASTYFNALQQALGATADL